jgi:hypothetical protein
MSSILISLLVVLAIVGVATLVGMAVVVELVRRRMGLVAGAIVGIVLGAMFVMSPVPRYGAAMVYMLVPQSRLPLARIDLALSRGQREEIVRLVNAGALDESRQCCNDYELPASARGLTVHGDIAVIDDACGRRVFFMTLTAMSPDPYAGFEFVPDGCKPEKDPYGSGHGIARSLGDGWFWIVAS